MGAVVEARNKEGKDFVIIARIDAGATMGDAEVIARAQPVLNWGLTWYCLMPFRRIQISAQG